MDIFSLLECIKQCDILREPSEHSYLDLRVVCYEEHITLTRDEAWFDIARVSYTCWDILEIGIIRAHASCRCTDLTIGRMHSISPLIYES